MVEAEEESPLNIRWRDLPLSHLATTYFVQEYNGQ